MHMEKVISSSKAIEYTRKDYDKYANDDSHPVLLEFFRLEMVKLDTAQARSERRSHCLQEVLQQHTSYRDALVADPDIVGKYTRACIDYYSFT